MGCGFDTLYWRLEDATRAGVNFVELDFPAVTAKKCHIIKRNKRLLQKITSEGRRPGGTVGAPFGLALSAGGVVVLQTAR